MINEHMTVAIRVRPFSTEELITGTTRAWEVGGPTSITDTTADKLYIYDRVYSDTSNEQIFEDLGEKMVWKAMEGFNSCLICHGQSKSGKSFTMRGTREGPLGFMQLAFQTIFAYIKSTPSEEFLVKCSYFEVYNECINDLLNIRSINLKIKEPLGVIYMKNKAKVIGLSEQVCISYENAISMIGLSNSWRQIDDKAADLRNANSHLM